MLILGLTGSIGMGKSWGSQCFRHFGIRVHDADACVHHVTGPGGTVVKDVDAAFPGVLTAQGGVDRQKLGAQVLNNDAKLQKLEAILHPQVRADQKRFLARASRDGKPLVVLDIPLLFETGARSRVDAVVVMSAPERIQRQRVLHRPGMTEEKFEAILERQTPDTLKRQLAHFVVSTGGPKGEALRQIGNIAKVAKSWPSAAWSPHWK